MEVIVLQDCKTGEVKVTHLLDRSATCFGLGIWVSGPTLKYIKDTHPSGGEHPKGNDVVLAYEFLGWDAKNKPLLGKLLFEEYMHPVQKRFNGLKDVLEKQLDDIREYINSLEPTDENVYVLANIDLPNIYKS
jgi:hypothetical protein